MNESIDQTYRLEIAGNNFFSFIAHKNGEKYRIFKRLGQT